MSAHTEGPWVIDTETRPAEICTIHGVPPQNELGQSWVYVRGALGDWDATPEEVMANARLIAAAPDLLAALEAALSVIKDYLEYEHNGDPWVEDARAMGEMEIDDYERDGRLESARAAIAKATGSAK